MNLRVVLEELKKREPIFHHPELGLSRADLENMVAPEFGEVSASGKWYSREYVIDVTLQRMQDNYFATDVWETRDFNCIEIAPNNYLLTYILIQNKTRVTRRSTLWRYADNHWKILYHQGTVVQNSEGIV